MNPKKGFQKKKNKFISNVVIEPDRSSNKLIYTESRST